MIQVKHEQNSVSLAAKETCDLLVPDSWGKIMYQYVFMCLLVLVASQHLCLAVIAGVYSRNRNFRLLSSTKLGKSSGELKVARENQFHSRSSVSDCSPAKCSRLHQGVKTNLDRHSLAEETFLDSLICNVEYVVGFLVCCERFCHFLCKLSGFFICNAFRVLVFLLMLNEPFSHLCKYE